MVRSSRVEVEKVKRSRKATSQSDFKIMALFRDRGGLLDSKSIFRVLFVVLVFVTVYVIDSELSGIKVIQSSITESTEEIRTLKVHVGQVLMEEHELAADVIKLQQQHAEKDENLEDKTTEEEEQRLKKEEAPSSVPSSPPLVAKLKIPEIVVEEEKYSEEELMILGQNLTDLLKSKKPPNPDFVFHNKLPKCGSTTMNNIIRVCARRRPYNFIKLEPEFGIGFSHHQELVDYLRNENQPPFFLLMHHFYFDYEK